ncbi:hypothetical protein VTO42DRAFT_3141 [Malbranchea cinnamomea]
MPAALKKQPSPTTRLTAASFMQWPVLEKHGRCFRCSKAGGEMRNRIRNDIAYITYVVIHGNTPRRGEVCLAISFSGDSFDDFSGIHGKFSWEFKNFFWWDLTGCRCDAWATCKWPLPDTNSTGKGTRVDQKKIESKLGFREICKQERGYQYWR